MAVFKCKMCGGTVEFEPGATVGVCDSCGTKQTLPRLDDDRRANLYDRANHFRRNNDFDKAAGLYEQILNEDSADAEAYWSLVLCRYGIEYVEDPATHRRVPTVNRAQFTSVFDDDNYKSAIRYADIAQRQLYEDEARTINEIQKGILSISQKEEPFDVFICYKETDANGRRTPDSVLANDLYHQLTQEGFKVFFARITLEDKLGTAYEPYIFAALNSAKVMVVLGTKPEYFNAVWVKNEWSRYLSLVKTSGGRKVLIPAYKDMDPYDLPEEFSHLQAQDMSKLGFMQDLIRGIKKIAQKETPAPATAPVVSASGSSTAPLLKRAFMFLEDGNWQEADAYCEKVLDIDPENAQAYLGKLMAELKVRRQEELKNCAEPFSYNGNYRKAVRFGGAALKEELDGDIAFINERNENDRKTGIYNDAVKVMGSACTEVTFRSAANKFRSISGFKDADALAEECLAKAESSRKDAIYASAKEEMAGSYTTVRFEKALKQFERISGWKDADAQILLCQKKIEEIKANQEAKRLEEQRMAEEQRIAAEKAAKKRKKIIAITIPSVCACIAFVILLTQVIIPRQKYNKAMSLIDAGDYDAAYEMLEEIGNNEAIAANKYDRAMGLIDAGENDSAYALLEEIRDNEAITASKYEWAMERIEAQDYGTAYTLLDGLNYKDSEEKRESIKPQYYEILLSRANVGDAIFFGYYEQDNDISNGREDIEWIVLAKEENRLLVISRYALDCQVYNIEYSHTTWESCTLRKWLNNDFFRAAFPNDEERKRIVEVTVPADDNPQYDVDSGNDVQDKIFLLNIAEVNKYDTARVCKPTAYAVACNAHTGVYGNSRWWLRSPGRTQGYAAYVDSDGEISCKGLYVDYRSIAVRPAMWIELGD